MNDEFLARAVYQVGVNKFLKKAGILERLKTPGLAHHGLEVASLGAIAAGPTARLMGHPLDQKTDDMLDVAGLAGITGPEAIGAYKKLRMPRIK